MRKIPFKALDYHVTVTGKGPALILLHGFTGCGENWQALIPALSQTHQIITVDLAGHGQTTSPTHAKLYAIDQAAQALTHILDQLNLQSVDLLGYSMGGRLALYFALTHPQRLKSLMLESASPGLIDPADREARVNQDNALADRIEHEGISAFVAFWENIPLFASQKNLPPATQERLRNQRLKNNPIGLANSLRGMGTGVQPSLWDQLSALTLPTLLLTGALDAKFTMIGQQMANLLPNAHHENIAHAGHTLHLEQPQAYLMQIKRFLQAHQD